MNTPIEFSLSQKDLKQFHTQLREWYAAHGRLDLPWRNTDDPYPIYISEVMLQQTQVKTVLDRYYHPFLKRFPNLKALADAPQDDVLKHWEGLGYYNRAINLHKAAKQAAPALPNAEELLLSLPGIGKNTARALLAFGFRQSVAILEANVKRVVQRIFALRNAKDDALWALSEGLLDKHNAFDYNQAMMDIGATVCTKRKPLCSMCPASHICKGKDAPEDYPAPKKKKKTPTYQRSIVLWQDAKQRFYLSARDNRHLNGLYGFPQYEEAETLTLGGLGDEAMQKLGTIKHVYSHYTLLADVYLATYPTLSNSADWFELAEIDALALSKADHKALDLYKQLIL